MSDFQEVPLFDVGGYAKTWETPYERTPLPLVTLDVEIKLTRSLQVPGDLFRAAIEGHEGTRPVDAVYKACVDGTVDADILRLAGLADLVESWELEIIDSSPQYPDPLPEGWSWERFAAEIQHPTWRPIGGEQ